MFGKQARQPYFNISGLPRILVHAKISEIPSHFDLSRYRHPRQATRVEHRIKDKALLQIFCVQIFAHYHADR
jgi:hypothetical protein